MGYFGACSIKQKRIFIKREELPLTRHDTGYESCEPDTLKVDQIPYFSGGQLVVNAIFKGPVFIGYLLANPVCVDCQLRDGTLTKPDFW